jgi:hypothetical protein
VNKVIKIRRFQAQDTEVWNSFVDGSGNGTFLHNRQFMDYHSDRFDDHSMIVEADNRVVALLPANRAQDTLQSHGGLTYAGLLIGASMSAELMFDLVSTLVDTLRADGFKQLHYKAIPHIYHQYPSEQDIYALVQHGARMVRCDLSSAIAIGRSPKFSKSKRQGVNRARKAGLLVEESTDFGAFWSILSERLSEAHDAAPTHSLEEIRRLQCQFPQNIRLYVALGAGGLQGGVVIFDSGPVVHVQYMATTEDGRRDAALDLIISHLLETVYCERLWFNFGISTTDGGKALNTGLARQKEMFGARSVLFYQYELDIS